MYIGTFGKLRHVPRALEAHNSSNKRKTTLEDLETFKPIQTQYSGKRAKGVTEQPFAEEIRYLIHASNQPIQQKPEIFNRMRLSRKYMERTLLFGVLDSHEFHGRQTAVLSVLYQQKYCQPGLKGTETG